MRAKFDYRCSYKNWIRATLVLMVGALACVSLLSTSCSLIPNNAPVPTATLTITPTRVTATAPAVSSEQSTLAITETSTPMRTPTPTLAKTQVVTPTSALSTIPTPPAGAIVLALTPVPQQSGWVVGNRSGLNVGDGILYVGVRQNQPVQSILEFDVTSLAPGSKILFAALDLTARTAPPASATSGEWSLDILDTQITEWSNTTLDALRKIPALTSWEPKLKAQDITANSRKRFTLTAEQQTILQKQIDVGTILVRLNGSSAADNTGLLTWDATQGVREPTLYLIAIPAKFQIVMPTPTPADIFTAATRVIAATQQAARIGTATPLPRVFATVTPLPFVVITDVPTPIRLSDATATAIYATAVAVTTGTFTPTPNTWVTATPLPLTIPIASLTPIPTIQPTPEPIPLAVLAKQPVPSGLENKIIFFSGSRLTPDILVMDADGKNIAQLTNKTLYDIFAARDTISPDGQYFLFNAPDGNLSGVLQIWRSNVFNPAEPPIQLTFAARGMLFAPAWSPDGRKIAYTSTQDFAQEIFYYNFDDPKRWHRLTSSLDTYFINQHPSWSPDGKQIVYASDLGHPASFTEIWVMNADGSGAKNLGDGKRDAWSPIWVKWKK